MNNYLIIFYEESGRNFTLYFASQLLLSTQQSIAIAVSTILDVNKQDSQQMNNKHS